MKVFMIFVFIIVGLLEVVSILFRPVSLSFRLYGNVFAGENMLESMTHRIGACALVAASRCLSTSWNFSSAWCRRWFSCF